MQVLVNNVGERQRPDAVQIVSCVNCGVLVEEKYCGSCGQRSAVSKITWRSLGRELGSTWLGFDNQLGRTFIDLSLRPGKVILTYLKGNRVSYLGPVGYYFIVTALVLLVLSASDFNIEEFMKASGNGFTTSLEPPKGRVFEVQQLAFQYMSSAFRFMAILFVPFFALAGYFFFRKKGFNYLEHVVMMIYSSAHLFLLTLLQASLYQATGNVHSGISALLNLLYYGYFYNSIMSEKFSLRNICKGIGVVLSGYLILVLLMIVVMLGVLLLVR
ncbi:hypothetical protein D770_06260 [Flammeovirgaceae bacterium 311]|nr:hypothetical protein D770_06260 [Flammeovirgaceae bacterium 311]